MILGPALLVDIVPNEIFSVVVVDDVTPVVLDELDLLLWSLKTGKILK